MSRKERFTPQEEEQACIDYIEGNRSRSEICRELYISTSTMNIPVRRVLPHENIQMVGLTTTELSNKTSNNWLNGIAIVFPFVPLMNLLFYLLHQFLNLLERFSADCMFHPACIMICSFWRYPISSKNLLRNSAVLHFIYYIGHVHCGYSVGYQDNRFLSGGFF